MVTIGMNTKGEQLAADAAGTRFVLVDGNVIGQCSSSEGFDPFSCISPRYLTVEESIAVACRHNADGSIEACGAIAAVEAMLPRWKLLLANGAEASSIAGDVHGVKTLLDEMLTQLGFTA